MPSRIYGIKYWVKLTALDSKSITGQCFNYGASNANYIYIELTDDYLIKNIKRFGGFGCLLPVSDSQVIICSENGKLTLYNRTEDLSITQVKNIYISGVSNLLFAIITPNRKKLIIFYPSSINTNIIIGLKISIFNIEDILNYTGISSNDTVKPIQNQTLDLSYTGYIDSPQNDARFYINNSGTRLAYYWIPYYSFNGYLCELNCTEDKQNLLGIKYKNETFVKIKSDEYTARASDVIKDKTFIGKTGQPETGTMEV